jgi:hypothetical protein
MNFYIFLIALVLSIGTSSEENRANSSVSLDKLHSLLSDSSELFEDCQIEELSYDKNHKWIKFTVIKNGEKTEYTISDRLKIISGLDGQGEYVVQFERGFLKENEDHDAQFEHEVTKLRIPVYDDLSPKSLYVDSESEERDRNLVNLEKSLVSRVWKALGFNRKPRSDYSSFCQERKNQPRSIKKSVHAQSRHGKEEGAVRPPKTLKKVKVR